MTQSQVCPYISPSQNDVGPLLGHSTKQNVNYPGLHIAKLHMAISVPFFAYIPAGKQKNKSARGVSLQDDKDSVIFFVFKVLGISTSPNTFTMIVTATAINSLKCQFSRVLHRSLSQEVDKGSIRDLGNTTD